MAATVPENAISERAQHFLKVLIERYIRDGQPVGSRTLAKDAGLDLSPATIRNVMADLEDLGFVASPHTSAGRVPTESPTTSGSSRACRYRVSNRSAPA